MRIDSRWSEVRATLIDLSLLSQRLGYKFSALAISLDQLN